MSQIDLLFESGPAANGELVFGLTDTPTGASQVVIAGSFAPLQAALDVRRTTQVAITGSFSQLQAAVSAQYSSQTARPTVAQTESPWQVADKPNQNGVEFGQQGARSAPVGWAAFWQRATGLQPNVEHRLPDVLRPTPVSRQSSYQEAEHTRTSAELTHQEADRSVRRVLATAFENAALVRNGTVFRHQDGDRRQRSSRRTGWVEARLLGRGLTDTFQQAAAYLFSRGAGYQEGVPPPPGISVPPVPPLPPSGCYTPSGDLLFSFPWAAGSAALVFQCGDYVPPGPTPGETIVVPVQKVYIVINSASLYRVSDNALIPTFSLSLSLDAGSWTWGFDASLPLQAQALVEPTTGPVELRAVINGTEFRLLAENLSRERSFGTQSLRVSGRGRNAILDAPYAPSTSYSNEIDRTAQQIAGDILTYNGVPIGWSVDWGLTDWLVPAGVFAHQGTHISALNAVVQAAGGYLQPHRTAATLRVLPMYPSAPWAWGAVTPDFELPADVTTRESIQWVEKPSYNRVFVSGQQTGVLGQVTRTGTAGDLLAQTVVDPLITHADAARQRGIAVLSDTGRIATVGLSLPVLAETGVIEPGKFVRYVDGGTTRLGLVRSTSVSVGESAAETRQQIVMEVHE